MSTDRAGETATGRITTASGEERVPYESLLRSVGQYLDEQGGTSLSLIEVPGGFTLRFQRPSGPLPCDVVHFEWHELFESGMKSRQVRGPGTRNIKAKRLPSTDPSTQSATYQDILRALGRELEQVPAYTIALDELDDGILTTYLYLDPAHGYLAKKRMVVVPASQEETLLIAARARRAEVPGKRWGIRLFTT